MKQIKYKRVIIFCVIVMISVIIHVFQSYPDTPIWSKLFVIIVRGAGLFFGSAIISAFGALIIFISAKGVIWLFEEKKVEEPDLVSLFYGLLAVVFCVAYYELLTGKIIGVI